MVGSVGTALACADCRAQGAGTGEAPFLRAAPEDLAWFTEARFGMFVHWGPVSLKGTEIGWSRGGVRRGLAEGSQNLERHGVPVEEYDNLYKRFNPVKFDADEWVALMRDAGMRYLVFTTKHHDGFSMFDSALTDYDIAASPFRRDIAGELAAACRKAGIRVGWYYSPPDWRHPDYYTETHDRYVAFMHGQVEELLSNYGRIDIMWFDGLTCTADKLDSKVLFKRIRELQPHILINNRAGLPADFDTPEQTVGRYQDDRPWESCITVANQWAWKPDDVTKSLRECLHTLISCAGGDGNLLFNVGPRPDGTIEPDQVQRLRDMGAWLRRYGQTIYGTRGGPIYPATWGVSTRKGRTAYLHILRWTSDPVRLPALPCGIVSSRLLTGGEVAVEQTDGGVTVRVPEADRDEIDTIVELQLEREIEGVLEAPSGALSTWKPATASNWWAGPANTEYEPAKAFDDDSRTRWASESGTGACRLEVDLAASVEIGRAYISEYGGRVRAFAIEYRGSPDEPWEQACTGGSIGHALSLEFQPVTARYVRLNVTETIAEPTIYEFQLFEK
jgi:alpha-L-fucosidase